MEDLAFWRNIALVFLIIQFFVLVVVAVAVSYLLVRVTANLHVHAQRGAEKAQEVGHMVAEKSDTYAEKARAPIVKSNAVGAGIVAGIRTLFAGNDSKDEFGNDTTTARGAQPGNRSGRDS